LVLAIIAFVCEFVAIKVKQTKQQQQVNAIRDGDRIIEDLESNSKHQTAIEAIEIDQRSQITQEDSDEDSESQEVIAGGNRFILMTKGRC